MNHATQVPAYQCTLHQVSCWQVLGGLLAGLAVLGGSQRAFAIDLEDERNKSRMAGYDLIYEARELELPQEIRDGLKQVSGFWSWQPALLWVPKQWRAGFHAKLLALCDVINRKQGQYR